jgi:hypothetical protein
VIMLLKYELFKNLVRFVPCMEWLQKCSHGLDDDARENMKAFAKGSSLTGTGWLNHLDSSFCWYHYRLARGGVAVS